MEVSQLKPEVVCRLRSGICITSCAHAVEELVINAIDAGATCIAVRVNLQFFKIQVVDNGEGIPADDLKHIGERYMTSKCHTLEDLEHLKSGGFRGEALSSLKDVSSILEIVSRHCRSDKTFCKIFKHGQSLFPSLSKEPRPSKGTTVTVLDFLYNMPVRRKCISEALDLELCRKCIENIALMHPGVSFSLRSDVTGEVCLQTRKSSSSLSVFMQLFGHEKATNLKEVTKECAGYCVEGYISTEGHVSKDLQFIYVNKRYVSKTKIHKWINKVLDKALFTKQKMYYKDVTPNALINSPSKTQIRYSIFMLNIMCPFSDYDIIFEPRKTMIEFENWSTVMELIQSAVVDFLTSQNIICASDISDTVLLNALTSVKSAVSVKPPENYGRDISVENTKNALFSATAKRALHLNKDCMLNGKHVSDVSSVGGEGCTPRHTTSSYIRAENGINSENPDLHSADSSSDSKFSCGSESLIQPIVHNHTTDTRNNNAERKSFLLSELNDRKNIFCSENIDLNTPSANVSESDESAENTLGATCMPVENDSRLSSFSESKSLVEDPLYKESGNRSVVQNSATLNNSKLWSVENPVLLKIPIESSISLLKKQTAKSGSFSSDEFPSPEETELPDFSVIPSKNPILLRVPMKSSLSALERRAKRTQKFAELKNKYEFSSKKQIKSRKNIHKNVHITGDKNVSKHHNNGNIFKARNTSLDEQSFLATESQQKMCFPQGTHVQNPVSASDKTDNMETSNNDLVLNKNLLLESIQKTNAPNNNLESAKGVTKDDSSVCVDTPQKLGNHLIRKYVATCKNQLTGYLFPLKKDSTEDRKDSESGPFSIGLFGTHNNGSNIVRHFHVKSKASDNAIDVPPEKMRTGLHSHVANSHSENEALNGTGGETVEETRIPISESVYTADNCKYVSNSSNLEITEKSVHGKSGKDCVQVHKFLFRNQIQSLILSSSESDSEVSSEREFHHRNFLGTFREENDNLHAHCENTDYDCNFIAKPKNMNSSNMEIEIGISPTKTLLETQPFSITEETKSLGFEPEIGEMDSDKAENDGDTNINSFHGQKIISECTDKRNCLSVNTVTSENYKSSCDGSDSEVSAKTTFRDNDVRPFVEETKSEQIVTDIEDTKSEQIITDMEETKNEWIITVTPETSSIKTSETHVHQGDVRDLCNGRGRFCSTNLSINASDKLLVKNTESQEDATVSSVEYIEPRCVTVPDSLDDENISKKCTYDKDTDCLGNQNVPEPGELLGSTAVCLKSATAEEGTYNTTSQDGHSFYSATQKGLKFASNAISQVAYKNIFTPNVTLSFESRTFSHSCSSLDVASANHHSLEPVGKVQNIDSQSKYLYHSHPHSLNESSHEALQTVFINKSGNIHNQMDISEKNDYIKTNEIFTGVSFEDIHTDETQPTMHFVDTQQPKQLPANSNSEDLFPSKNGVVEGLRSVNSARHDGTLGSKISLLPHVAGNDSNEAESNKIFTGVSFEDIHTDETQRTLHFVDSQQLKQLPANSNSEDLFPSKNSIVEGLSSINAARHDGTSGSKMSVTPKVAGNGSYGIKRSFDESQSKAVEVVIQKPDIFSNKSSSEFVPVNKLSVSEAIVSPVSQSSVNAHQFPEKSRKNINSFSFEGDEQLDQQLTGLKKTDLGNTFLVNTNFSNNEQCGNGAFFTKVCDANKRLLSSGGNSEQKTKDDDKIYEKADECRNAIFTSQLTSNSDSEVQISGKQFQSPITIPETKEIPLGIWTDKTSESEQWNHELSKSSTGDGCKPVWFPQQDPVTNEVIYVHSVSGNSSYVDPVENYRTHAENERYLQKHKPGQKVQSHFFLSHDATPFLPRPAKLRKKGKGDASPEGRTDFNGDPTELKDNLENYLEEQDKNDLARKWNTGQMNAVDMQVEEMFNSWENPVFIRCASEVDMPSANIGHLQPNQLKMYSIINSYRFTKAAFSHLKVIGQVDCKFIACIVPDVNETIKGKNLLVLFDQHAVHERIRLEQLIDDLFEVNRQGQKTIKTAELSSPVVIHLKQEEIRLLKAYHNKLAHLGLRLSLQNDTQDVRVYTVPTCLIERENNDLKRKRQPVTAMVVENLIREWLISLEQTRSTSSVLPKTLIGILNSQACRGAVKFGDPLDISQCCQLMQSLSLCKLPFQCAHGRPSLAPLLDLDKVTNLAEKKPKPVLSKIIKRSLR